MTTHTALPATQAPTYRWYILGLAALTFTFVMAIPAMSLSVLFAEIADDLHLNLVQIGWIWGIGSVMGVVVGLLGGPLSDRLGARRTLVGACLIMGLVGAARAVAWDFTSLAVTMFVMGLASSAIPMNVHKICSIWFSGARLGMANGVVSMGMALGFMIGSLIAATFLSPLLGGWRNVLLLYGLIALFFSLFWAFSQEKQAPPEATRQAVPSLAFQAAFRHVISLPNVWLFSLATMGVASCITGMLGYLPLYLRDLGWPEASADSALAAFHAVSMAAVIPIALLSDRLGARKGVLMVAALFVVAGVGLLVLVQGQWIWLAVILAGVTRDGFMAVTMTALQEVKGVGSRYAASASGVAMAGMGIGNLIAPPLGNSLAAITPATPFVLWAGLALLSFFGYLLIRE